MHESGFFKNICDQGRPSDNPLIVHICRWEDIYQIAGRDGGGGTSGQKHTAAGAPDHEDAAEKDTV